MNVVIAPDQFTAANNYSVTKPAPSAGTSSQHYFFNVPAGAPAFKVDLSGAGDCRVPGRSASCAGTRMASASTQREPQLLQCRRGGCSTGSPTSRTVTNPQAGVWEVDGGRAPHSDAGRALHAHGLHPGRHGLAQPGRDPLGDDRRAGRALLHPHQPVRRLHRPRRGHRARQRARCARRPSRTSRSSSSRHRHRPVRPRCAPRSAARPIRRPTSTCSSSTAPPALACWPARRRRRLRGVGDDQQPGGRPWVVAGRWLRVPAGTTTYNYVDVFANRPSARSRDRRQCPAPGRCSWTVPGA